MAAEGNSFEIGACFESQENDRDNLKSKSLSTPAAVAGDDCGSFDCNICLDSAHDPVVTLCGHLYCWPCIYKWVHVQSSSLDSDQPQPSCPVCKANVSVNSLVPLYGRGKPPSESASKKTLVDSSVPRRPPPYLNTLMTNNLDQNQRFHPNLFQRRSQSFHHQPYGAYTSMSSSNFHSTTMTSIFNPMIGIFGDHVFARIFGPSHMSFFAYPYPNTTSLLANSNPRMRRHEMQLETSLNRVTIFLLCCIVLCLLLF